MAEDTTTYADEHECGQLRLGVPGEQVSLLPLPDSLIPTTQDEEDPMSGQPEVMDLTTAEGCVAWMKELPTENLRAIAARPLDQFNALLVCAAEGELIVRATTS